MKIANYRVLHTAGGTDYFLRATIELYDEGKKEIGRLNFYKKPSDVEANPATKAPSGYMAFSYPSEQYSDVLDLLRNEGPVYLNFKKVADNLNIGYLSTDREPVGEGDL